jgi:hypothetical protein
MSILYRHFISVSKATMKASIVDLRYKTKDILKALEKNESVTILYHGKIKGIIHPAKEKSTARIIDHPFFAMNEEHEDTVLEELEKLRKPRYDL